jgi:hypothetical protein
MTQPPVERECAGCWAAKLEKRLLFHSRAFLPLAASKSSMARGVALQSRAPW